MPEPVKKPMAGAYYCPEALPMLLAGWMREKLEQRYLQQEIDAQQDGKLSPSEEVRRHLRELL